MYASCRQGHPSAVCPQLKPLLHLPSHLTQPCLGDQWLWPLDECPPKRKSSGTWKQTPLQTESPWCRVAGQFSRTMVRSKSADGHAAEVGIPNDLCQGCSFLALRSFCVLERPFSQLPAVPELLLMRRFFFMLSAFLFMCSELSDADCLCFVTCLDPCICMVLVSSCFLGIALAML